LGGFGKAIEWTKRGKISFYKEQCICTSFEQSLKQQFLKKNSKQKLQIMHSNTEMPYCHGKDIVINSCLDNILQMSLRLK